MSKGHLGAQWCRHFTGLWRADGEARCEAGVRYTDVKGEPDPTTTHRDIYPCFAPGKGGKPCPHQSFPTPEELAKQREEDRAHMARLNEILQQEPNRWHAAADRPLCSDKHRGRLLMHLDARDSFTNVYECAECGGTLVSKQQRRGPSRAMWRG